MIHKYVQKIEVFDEAKLTTLDDKLAPHITSYKFKAIPGEYYVVTLTVVDDKECVVATGEERCKAGLKFFLRAFMFCSFDFISVFG